MGILINSLCKSFGDKSVISYLTCELPDVGLVKVSGVSGAGKTTLLRILSGLDREYTGSITGVGSVSYLFQEHRLFPWLSALDNVLVAAFEKNDPESKAASEDMLIKLGFSEGDMSLKPSKLSGGMKQRVAIARALLRSADVLILDEPTKELDAALVDTVSRLIEHEAKLRPVILVSHDSTLDALEYTYEINV